MLSATQFKRIEAELPLRRRNLVMISALLYRSSSGQSLRDVAEAYGISRTRLSEWDALLAAEMPRLMRKLGLEAASWLAWRGGGQAWQARHNCAADVNALRLENFGRALRRTR